MSAAKKQKTSATKGVPQLGELCTKQLWKQSIEAGKANELVNTLIEAGKANELVNTLAESEAGQCALKARGVDCIIINRVGSDSVFFGFIRRCPQTEVIFLLLEAHAVWAAPIPSHYDVGNTTHPLGGLDITWENEEEMERWVRERVEKMSTSTQRRFFRKVLKIRIPKKDLDGDKIHDALAYLENEDDEWYVNLHDKVYKLLVDTWEWNNKVMIDRTELKTFREKGNPMLPMAVFTLYGDGFTF